MAGTKNAGHFINKKSQLLDGYLEGHLEIVAVFIYEGYYNC